VPWGRLLGDGFRSVSPIHLTSIHTALTCNDCIPTRAYAAAFIAIGVLLQRGVDRTLPSVEAHVDHLLDLLERQGPTPVEIIYSQKKTSGIFVGLDDSPSGLRLTVELSKGLVSYLPIEQGLRIQPTKHLKNAGRIKPIIGKGQQFVVSMLDGIDATQYLTTSCLECALIGARSRIHEEIMSRTIQFNGHEGSLQDVLRARSCSPPGNSYRCDIFPEHEVPAAPDETPRVVIFDGARAFLKRRYDWVGASWFVLLDRTEVQFDDAVAQVNADYRQREGDLPELSVGAMSSAVEIVAFHVNS